MQGKNIDKKKSLEGDGLILKNLFDDIFNFEDTPTDVVRLNASTIEQLLDNYERQSRFIKFNESN